LPAAFAFPRNNITLAWEMFFLARARARVTGPRLRKTIIVDGGKSPVSSTGQSHRMFLSDRVFLSRFFIHRIAPQWHAIIARLNPE